MIGFLVLLLGLAELVNAEWLHRWTPTPGEIAALILIVGAMILLEGEKEHGRGN